jgi:cytochrome c-type biogenesis protein CcmH
MLDRVRKVGAGVLTAALLGVVLWGLVVGEETTHDRVLALGDRIRCPVCQGEAITESAAETAVAMLEVVAEKVAAGESDAQIISYFTQRYGDGILLDPRFEPRTMLLWVLPAAALAVGGALIATRLRRGPES